MTKSELKRKVEETGSFYFSRENMKFAGDTMANFKIIRPRLVQTTRGERMAYELRRKNKTPRGYYWPEFFDTETFERLKKA
jgi:hypothetical protein